MGRYGKIESSLNERELREFIEQVRELKNPTPQAIQSLAYDKWGIEVSVESARTFKKNIYEKELDRLRAAQDFALKVAGIHALDTGATFADASAAIIAQEAFEMLSNNDWSDLNTTKLKDLAMIVTRLRASNQRETQLKAIIHEKETREKERRNQAKKLKMKVLRESNRGKGISNETRAMFDELLGFKS